MGTLKIFWHTKSNHRWKKKQVFAGSLEEKQTQDMGHICQQHDREKCQHTIDVHISHEEVHEQQRRALDEHNNCQGEIKGGNSLWLKA